MDRIIEPCLNVWSAFLGLHPKTRVYLMGGEAPYMPKSVPKETLGGHLCEFLWQRDVKRRNADPFAETEETDVSR